MAEAAIQSAVSTLGELASQKVSFLLDVEEQVKWLKDELKMLQSLLKDAAEKQTYDHRMREWISEVRKVAQDAEDVIETFILKIDTPRSSRGLIAKCLYFPIYLYHLNRVGDQIRSIKVSLEDLIIRLEKYKGETINNEIRSTSTKNTESRNVDLWRQLIPRQKDKHLVGLDEGGEKIKRVILEDTKGRSVISIAGMGGIGKSSLARVVYNDADVIDRFECCAWVSVSREFKPQEIIMEIMRQVIGPNQEKLIEISEVLPVARLKIMLYGHLRGKRYFIVMDDVWESAHWECLQSAFPDEEDKESRLLLTSRKQHVAVTRYTHSMEKLAPEDGWQLLLKKALRHRNNGKCPKDLVSIGKNILERCKGLPLAITSVGDLLAKREQSFSEWEKVYKAMKYNFQTDTVQAILELSYHNLSPELKSCFLCLGFFNEGAPINAEKLIQVWIAEGLVSNEGGQKTAEEIARHYLDELISHNMVQVMEITVDNQVKKCCIQEFLLELSVRKAIEEISFEILKEGSSQSSDKPLPRHRSIYCSTERFLQSMNQNKRLRSLFFHKLGNVNGSPHNWKSFELLRLLDLENFGLEKLPEAIGSLVGLRYLGLRNNKIRRLPRSLGRLRKLEVLDMALNPMVEVPNVIWKMESLRHLFMSGIKCKVPLRIDMKNLQTLLYIPVAYWKAKQMTSLKKLGIELDKDSDASELFKSLAELQNLFYLKLALTDDQSMPSLDRLHILLRLAKLKLQGCLTKLPSASDFPPNLSCLSLVQTNLHDDPMPTLEKLRNLRYLKLHQAYTGDNMKISNDGFSSLEVLSLSDLKGLKNLEVGNSALQELQRLEIKSCPHLESLPEQVSTMNKLEELNMVTTKEIASKLRRVDSLKTFDIKSVDQIFN